MTSIMYHTIASYLSFEHQYDMGSCHAYFILSTSDHLPF